MSSDNVLLVLLFLTMVFFMGTPDLHDVLIKGLTK